MAETRIASLQRETSQSPTQWSGLAEDGRPVYARYRMGRLRVWLGEWTLATPPALTWLRSEASEPGRYQDGRIENDELVDILTSSGLATPGFTID